VAYRIYVRGLDVSHPMREVFLKVWFNDQGYVKSNCVTPNIMELEETVR